VENQLSRKIHFKLTLKTLKRQKINYISVKIVPKFNNANRCGANNIEGVEQIRTDTNVF